MLYKVLSKLAKPNLGKADRVINDIIFGDQPPSTIPVTSLPPWKPVNPGLNAVQINAISAALSAKDIHLIHGPPGTGMIVLIRPPLL